MVEETGTNDAAGPPDGGNFPQIQRVAVLFTGQAQEGHPLGVGTDLTGVECIPHSID